MAILPDRTRRNMNERKNPRDGLRKEVTVHSWDYLPCVVLQPRGPSSAEIIARGVTDFRAAGRYLQALPYGRTANRADFNTVLREGKGTCSTKHALLAKIAREQELEIALTLGIYEMHERNTPGVGAVLTRHGFASIPEAHCYLTYRTLRIDITRSSADPAESISRFLYEEIIVPEQIGDYKIKLHREFMQRWINSHMKWVGERSFEEVWQIREECIAALTQ